ncbi:hypothetical protein [Oleiharenicola sp. Vm1]|uniref:hypothetical protein n=1 Tax=Oleiharenicola sp. Vm1 TaxID=3398393 RepID=UPI0039F51CCB
MATQQQGGAVWTQELIQFLQTQPAVAAVRVNAADMTVSVATLGSVDQAQLEQQIQEVLLAIEAKLATGRARGEGR